MMKFIQRLREIRKTSGYFMLKMMFYVLLSVMLDILKLRKNDRIKCERLFVTTGTRMEIF